MTRAGRFPGARPTMHTSYANWFYSGVDFVPFKRPDAPPELSPCIPIRVNPYPASHCKQRLFGY
ncbi:hypothetical protein BLAT2472_60221 [Burkholderia latens]